MIRRAHPGLCTARELRDLYAGRVHQLLAAELSISWERMPFTPNLSTTHRQSRIRGLEKWPSRHSDGG